MTVDQVKDLIKAERARQDALHPADWTTWAPSAILCVLAEEIGEVAKAVNDRTGNGVRQELVEVAAVCVRWLEALLPGGTFLDAWAIIPYATVDHAMPPTQRVSTLCHRLDSIIVADFGWKDVLRRQEISNLASSCVRWLLWFEDDPTTDAEKKRIQNRKVSEA